MAPSIPKKRKAYVMLLHAQMRSVYDGRSDAAKLIAGLMHEMYWYEPEVGYCDPKHHCKTCHTCKAIRMANQ